MPKVLPTIPNDPPQGIQALLDKVYLWNPDAANNLIIRINELLEDIEEAGGAVASVNGQTGAVVLTAEDIKTMFAGEEETLQMAIDTLKTDQGDLGEQVGTIEGKIPETASETNQLVTKNEVLALPTFTYKVVNELPEIGEEKIIYLVPKAGDGNDVHNEYIWVNSAYELIGTTAVDLSGYLPLTGGILTGELTIDAGETPGEYYSKPILTLKTTRPSGAINKTVISSSATGLDFGGAYITRIGDITPSTNSAILGNGNTRWQRLYVAEIANGNNPKINVPTKGGTFALAEDIAEAVTTKELTVGTEEGTLNIGITAGTATIATNNGLDIVSPTKFDTAPTTDDSTAWADVNATALVTKAQVTTALSTAGGGTSVTIRNWA